MIVKEEFLNSLRQLFALNLYEVRIWTALLSRGVSTAGELSDIGNVPRSRAYDVLESLEKKGFVVMKLGKPIKYIAVEPSEVVERAKKFLVQTANEKVKKLGELKGTDVLTELDVLYTQGVQFVEPTDLSGALRGRHNIYTHLETLVKNAEKNVVLVTSAKGLMRKFEVLKPEFEKLKKKGVEIKIASNLAKENFNNVKDLLKYADVRTVNNLNARFAIIDGKDLMFMVMDDNEVHPTYDVGVWVKTPYFAKALGDMFELVWKDLPEAKK
jgi:HTH-type transcriptional regulator, sugar sensing transcriptional regulator